MAAAAWRARHSAILPEATRFNRSYHSRPCEAQNQCATSITCLTWHADKISSSRPKWSEMTVILSSGLISQHLEHSSFDDDTCSNERLEEDDDELLDTSHRASESPCAPNVGSQGCSVGAVPAPRIIDAIAGGDVGSLRLLLATALASFIAGVSVAPRIRDTPSIPIGLSIMVALLIVCGSLIMELFCTRERRNQHLLQTRNEGDEATSLKKNYLLAEEYQRGRKRILKALGSVHEFPLAPDDRTVSLPDKDITAAAVQSINECAKFAEVSTELLQSIDDSLEVLRIGAGLQLGLGPASKSVCRVENTLVGREYRKARVQQQKGISAPLGLGRAREILFCVMADQFQLLNSFLVSPSREVLGCGVEDGQVTLRRDMLPPLTLSSLVTWRKALGELQFQVLSEFCKSMDTVTESMEAQINTIRERTVYLQSSFPSGHSKVSECSEEKGAGKHVQKRHLDNIYKRIDASLVSIWAFEKSLSFPDNLDSKEEFEGNHQIENEKWWLRSRDMLQEAIAYWHELDLHLSSTGIIKYHEEEDDVRSNQDDATKISESRRGKNDGTYECATENISLANISNGIDAHPSDKTIIFSGKASRRRLHDKKVDRDKHELDAPASLSSYRSNLFTELQSRIDNIELADEWDANQEAEDGSDSEVIEGGDLSSATNKAMPMGLNGGSLLAELKSTIAVGSSEGAFFGD